MNQGRNSRQQVNMRSMSARLARSLTGTRTKVDPVLDPLVSIHRKIHPKADIDTLQHAYRTAERLHEGVYRKSGDPYITHPLAVATIAAEIGMDTTTLVAALLHDTVEDTDYSLEDLTAEFGEEVARLVDGVTKLDKVALGAAAEAETIRKMIVAMSQDPRVLVIKVADRLHNMRTMRFLPPEKQAKKARQTLEVIAPLAHRLGMATIKWELEDLSFAILYPKKYDEIVRLVADRAPSRDRYLAEIIADVQSTMRENSIAASVMGRPKHYWSIYQKMIVRGRDFDEIFDLVGIRILVDNLNDCYAAIGAVHSLYSALPGRFKDYISAPRFGVYQSLHTTVMGPGGKALEVQVRTHEMHYNAEFGIAAHWRYKETKGSHSGEQSEVDQMAWMRQLLDWQKEAADPNEFLDSLRYDLQATQIFVFTPKGDVVNLPVDATPVDFAYAVHTEVGHRCIGAKVNGRLVALESKLKSGDRVEVFTSKDPGAGPSADWQKFVVSPRAKAKIRQWFAKERREESLELGRDALAAEVQRGGLPMHRLFTAQSMKTVATELHYPDVDALYTAIGSGAVSAKHVASRLMANFGSPDEAEDALAARTPFSELVSSRPQASVDGAGILVEGSPDVMAKLSKCCGPVPGDAIFGFVTRGGGVSVHRTDCTNASKLHEEPERLISVAWASEGSGSVFAATLQLEALDRSGLLFELTRVINEQRVTVTAMNSYSAEDHVAVCRFTFEVSDTKQLGSLMTQLRNTEGVFDVYRVSTD
ncbi:bifunctional (p)ppGpp synthetase/guanosine-3',5'-bis(diphosphate) 3'-pyrophosphohydrolase [Corynebacterium sp. CCM 8835]|uniref:Bifunctional (P)ppGpp synthetase/guanosine-3',5'-bis(Diphosphate) 3'-pyrophosphohydrolase n=1 Tax=Corynebacterium antarcticum TaxID=2800405 RepID=A0A9Q4CA28_9CORY|nr:bifunctional (p)ppGpp synthetase/guanosine-3',5'-bis(diphosphate) 3'-pyrophosphohydrolase [Corynebacterium antarcticum]MCK7641527.1 bifunctional (p)ppGpp synthetase/guanosine-3',5'-bis(diphosphate) 3'-pyrophosphohydrolase [Corynebacterium antarcticum]MCK7660375.1 bifunctional (p)ppGpp synthetase/guanosine-3',5'-bis(diphosphate) 3'-pyrophosphohydrolase [Corynebacterium antarcticum]MCL0244755.1 bifunctional (p)ppGpp synthetase/guanosine-3',5'-bis(diphosphate) 3'-pyrophosphohydrolase [Corynebact